ncbi:MAG: GNAT family N-acetyltransferase [Propioniciclava sp.]
MADSGQGRARARLATAEDLDALVAIETARTQGLSRTYLDLQEQGDFSVIVGLLDDAIAGRVILDLRPIDGVLVPELKLLWVAKEARRQGLGAVMTGYLEDLAVDLGYDEIFLGVNPDDPAAIPLYISMDYTPTGEHRNPVNVSVVDADQTENGAMEAIYRKSLRIR